MLAAMLAGILAGVVGPYAVKALGTLVLVGALAMLLALDPSWPVMVKNAAVFRAAQSPPQQSSNAQDGGSATHAS